MKADPRKPAVFLDRDGCVSREIGYVNHVDNFELLPHTAEGIRRFREMGFKVVVITNQAGAARGYFPLEYIEVIHGRMESLLASQGAVLDGIYHCPHHPSSRDSRLGIVCNCRKPRPGLIERASADAGIDPARSYMIGDKYSDVALAHSVGAKGILVLTGYGRGEQLHFERTWPRPPDAICEDLLDAARWIASDRQPWEAR